MARLTRDVQHAAAMIRGGGLVAYPTEAVFGLGCDPRNELAVHRLLTAKQRQPDKGLILIGADFAQFGPYLRPVDATLHARAMASWPGPVTWLWPCRPDAPRWLTGDRDVLAVRITDHPLAADLCRQAGRALVSTSANRSGEPPARDAHTVQQTLGMLLDTILEGDTGGREKPSEIRDLITGDIVRDG